MREMVWGSIGGSVRAIRAQPTSGLRDPDDDVSIHNTNFVDDSENESEVEGSDRKKPIGAANKPKQLAGTEQAMISRSNPAEPARGLTRRVWEVKSRR